MNRTRTIAGAAALLALLVLAANATALDEGRQAPDFVAAASLDGQAVEFSLQEALADGPVVVYFFPAAFTRGCDIEAHAFASHHERDRKSTRLNSSHVAISYAVFCLK